MKRQRQPDQFEQMVAKLPEPYDGFPSCTTRAAVIKLLRRQHAQMVRLVKSSAERNAHGRLTCNCGTEAHGYVMACDDLLAELAKMKKAKP